MTQECILTAIRESIPTEAIIRAYMDESVEDEEEVIIEPIPENDVNTAAATNTSTENAAVTSSTETMEADTLPVEELPPTLSVTNVDNEKPVTRLSFNDVDEVSDGSFKEAPKTIERLEEISDFRNSQRKLEEEEEDGLKESVQLDMNTDVFLDDVIDLDKPNTTDLGVNLDFEDL
jgi:hypothetical protein